MMDALLTFLQAAGGLLAWFLLQPTAAGIAAGFAAGYAIGTAKNKTALAELGRGLIFGFAAYALVTVVQLIVAGRSA